MTITTIGSYVTTADEFIAHWTDVNDDRTANSLTELTVAGAFTLANFTTDRDAVDAKITALVGLQNAREMAIDDRDSQKANIRERLRQFRLAVQLNLKGTTYFKRVPTLPPEKAAESKFLRPFDDMAEMWTRIDADSGVPGFTPPLTLTGGYTLAGFTSDLAAMRTSYRAVTDAENDEDIARKERDMMLDPLKDRMLQYRLAIELEYGQGHPFLESLPEVTPAPGSTPDAVTASGDWNSASETADLSWNESTNPNLDHYSVRMTPGATYDTENDTVVGMLPVGTHEFSTTAGLTVPSTTASFRIYVVLTTGNEAGSNTVTIARP